MNPSQILMLLGALLLGIVLAKLLGRDGGLSTPDCYPEYVFRDFNRTGVTLRVQELTETVKHSKREKRFFHMMFESPTNDHADPRPMQVVHAIARDYVNQLYLPLDAALRGEDRRLGLPRLNPDNLEWVELLQGNLQATLLYYENKLPGSGGGRSEPKGGTPSPHGGHPHHDGREAAAMADTAATAVGFGSPTCCPHIIVSDPRNEEETLFADLTLVLHRHLVGSSEE